MNSTTTSLMSVISTPLAFVATHLRVSQFENRKDIENIKLTNQTIIPSRCFYGCYNLINIGIKNDGSNILPPNTIIKEYAFGERKSLKTITLPKNI